MTIIFGWPRRNENKKRQRRSRTGGGHRWYGELVRANVALDEWGRRRELAPPGSATERLVVDGQRCHASLCADQTLESLSGAASIAGSPLTLPPVLWESFGTLTTSNCFVAPAGPGRPLAPNIGIKRYKLPICSLGNLLWPSASTSV